MTVEQLWQPTPGGSGTYILELARALARGGEVDVVGLAARHSEGTAPAGLAVPVRQSRLPRRLLYEAWARARRPRAERQVGGADVVHATTWAVPGTRRPLVVTVHDLAFLREPADFTAHGAAYFRRAMSLVEAEATAVVVPSRATLEDCIAAGIDAPRLAVIPHGVRADPVSPGEVAAFRSAHGLQRPFLLWCGTVEPRKNLERQVRAFLEAADVLTDLDLVLAGPVGWGDAESRVAQIVDRASTGRVHRLGRLEPHELQVAYAAAVALVFASTWEGFGMPVLEAMAHGVPVVTSAGTSMAEIVGDAGVLVDPGDVSSIARGMVEVVDAGYPLRRRAALAAAAESTWDACARRTAEVYRAVG